jgi:Ca2+-binding RTX toxin-like protein
MAAGDIKYFTINQGGFELSIEAIDLGDGTTQINITSVTGKGDLNAIWWSDGDALAEGNTTLTKADNSLNMNGTGMVWDGYAKLSNPGLGPAGENKDTFLSQGETLSYTINVDWDDLDTVGIRATSVNGSGSIKGVDDEPDSIITFPEITVSDASVDEGDTAGVQITLSHGDYPYPITVNYETSDGTADGNDYTGTSGSVTFAPGDTSETITIATTEDGDVEGNETFNVTLTSASADIPGPDLDVSGAITDNTGVVTIIDDDAAPDEGGGPVLASLPPTYTGPDADPNDFDNLGNAEGTTIAGDGGAADTIYGGAGNDKINGNNGNDLIYGGSGNDDINGNNHDDTIYGGSGNDTITGGNGTDVIIGGYGADTITATNNDTIRYLDLKDTNDIISGFVSGNSMKLDLSAIDANSNVDGDQDFTWGGEVSAYPVVQPNSVTWYYDSVNNNVELLADTDGDIATAEFHITLIGITSIAETDFNTL